jgi:SpoVK/Ycf46/Vps4 family AAA+-type ATPase
VKARLRARLKAKTPVGVVVFIDEIDKAMANVEHDTSGVRMDQLRTLLTEMQDNGWHGATLVGVPGGGKSLLAKAFGTEAGVPTIALDLGDMEGPHVGESEAMLRTAIKVIKAVGRGHAFFIATSNNASVMRPELQRRFTKGTFFVDLLSPDERKAMWEFYETKFGLSKQARPDDDGWTGAEIKNCCEEAWDTDSSLLEAAKFVVPVAKARGPEIEEMRMRAHGKYLSASEPGTYSYEKTAMEHVLRALDLPTEKGKVN